MPEVPKLVWLLVAVVAAAIVIGGVVWLTDGGSTSSEEKSQLEVSIRRGLPRELKRIGTDRTTARSVSCASSTSDRYECVAHVHREGLAGTVAMLINATCDSASCSWHTVPNGAQEELEGPDPVAVKKALDEERQAINEKTAMPEPEYGWSTVTCAELEKAYVTKDYEFLMAAGSAVAYEAIASSPDADKRRLTKRAVGDLGTICGEASNKAFQPFEAGEAALLSSEGP